MQLNNNMLQDKAYWQSRGYTIPNFDRAAARERTMKDPVWVHFGSGNIFRAFIAVLQQRLLDAGLQDRGIIAAEGYDYEIVDTIYKPFDDLSISVAMIPDGSVKKTVVGSIVESVKTDRSGMSRLRDIFSAESLQMVSFTITEKGYDINRADGTLQPAVAEDFEKGPYSPKSFLGKLTSLCLHRYNESSVIVGSTRNPLNAAPLALVSMDNCSKNGILLHKAVSAFAEAWVKNGFADKGFLDYVNNPAKLSFPCTMIDKITPYPDANVAKLLADDGIENMTAITTALRSATAPFVNAEEPEYLVVEDVFPNGRPPLEKAGVIFTDVETVDKVEQMKVGTCLNPLHTAISVFGCILGFTKISDAMSDPDLHSLVENVAKEGLPVVVDPGVISPKEFIDTVINVRLPNPYIPDTPQRIATDTSRKLAARFGETIKAYNRSGTLDIGELRAIPLVLAGWCRYLMGVDDDGNPFELPPDPMLSELQPLFANITLGAAVDCKSLLRPILSNSEIFGVDLYAASVADRVVEYFEMMVKGKGAVRNAFKEYDK